MYIEEISVEELIGLEELEENLIQKGVYSNGQEREEYIKEKLEEVLKRLTKREREIVTMYYGLDGNEPKSRSEIGKIYNMSSERVRQCVAKAIRQMKPRCRRSKRTISNDKFC